MSLIPLSKGHPTRCLGFLPCCSGVLGPLFWGGGAQERAYGIILFPLLAEIRQKGSKEAPARPLHLYDTPYEPVPNGPEVDSERSACPRPRESRLPQDDERPPEEYDQPWEWKKERISKAFAGERGGPGPLMQGGHHCFGWARPNSLRWHQPAVFCAPKMLSPGLLQ